MTKTKYPSKISCSWAHWFGFRVHQGEGYKLSCFSLAPKFKSGAKPSKLYPDEKTSPTSQKHLRKSRCSHCTWSCWWGWKGPTPMEGGKKKRGNGDRFTDSGIWMTQQSFFGNALINFYMSKMSLCPQVVGCLTLTFRINNRTYVSWWKNHNILSCTFCLILHTSCMSTHRIRKIYFKIPASKDSL